MSIADYDGFEKKSDMIDEFLTNQKQSDF